MCTLTVARSPTLYHATCAYWDGLGSQTSYLYYIAVSSQDNVLHGVIIKSGELIVSRYARIYIAESITNDQMQDVLAA